MLGITCFCLIYFGAAQIPPINTDTVAVQLPFQEIQRKTAGPTPSAEETDPPAIDNKNKPTPASGEPVGLELVTKTAPKKEGFHWKAALAQSGLALAVQRGVDLYTEKDTRLNLQGPFFKDYLRSVKNLHGWGDGDPLNTNYIAHPFQGAVTGFIEVQNDPGGRAKQFEFTKSYWKSRLRAMGWAAAYSTWFEIGPLVSEASIGNVGLPAKYKAPGSSPKPPNGGMGFVDMVITPTVGTGWLVTEDILDRYVVSKIERRTNSKFLIIGSRLLFNPGRSAANLFRFKIPWYRESRDRITVAQNAGGD